MSTSSVAAPSPTASDTRRKSWATLSPAEQHQVQLELVVERKKDIVMARKTKKIGYQLPTPQTAAVDLWFLSSHHLSPVPGSRRNSWQSVTPKSATSRSRVPSVARPSVSGSSEHPLNQLHLVKEAPDEEEVDYSHGEKELGTVLQGPPMPILFGQRWEFKGG